MTKTCSNNKSILTPKQIYFCLITISLLILCDQFSKKILIDYLQLQPEFTQKILPFFDIVYKWNYGISFGLFSEHYQYSNNVFLALNTIIILYLVYTLYLSQNYLSQAALTLIIGGAIGNLMDRAIRGAVFDFLYFYYRDFSFPAFNLADSFISIGAAIFIFQYLREQ